MCVFPKANKKNITKSVEVRLRYETCGNCPDLRCTGVCSREFYYPEAEVILETGEDEDPGSEVDDPGSEVEYPESEVEDPGSEVEDPGSEVEDPGSEAEDPGSEAEDPGSEVEDPESEAEEVCGDPGPPPATINCSVSNLFIKVHKLQVCNKCPANGCCKKCFHKNV